MTARLISRIAGAPWAITAPALETILDIAAREPVDPASLEGWKQHMAPERAALAARAGIDLPGTRRAQLRDGVAILAVRGPIFRHANLMTDMSGATALATLATDLAIARDDPRVKAILLDIDSPGGETTGMTEAAQAIRAAAAVKPLVAFTEGSAASLAYLLGASAGEFVVAPDAVVGCLGVVAAMVDRREADARAGLRKFEIVSTQTPGKRPDPSTAEGYAAIQAVADRLAEEFLGLVAGMRGMAVADLLTATGGGGLVVGADAVTAGLADRLGGFEETLARLAAGAVPAAKPQPTRGHEPRPRPKAEDTTMTTPAPVPQADAPAPPQAVAPTVAATPAPVDLVAAERSRAAAIQTAMKPGFGALSALAIEQGWSAETFINAQAASAEAVTAATQAAATAAFQASLPAPVAGGGEPADPATLPPAERAKAEWDKDAKLRAEFGGNFDTYAAFARAQARNVVKLISRR